MNNWTGARSDALDQIANAHTVVGGGQPGRRYATQQINHAYATLLSSQVQGFCRDLHSEAVHYFVQSLPALARNLVQMQLTRNRYLDRGNPNPGNLGNDFGRLDLDLWTALYNHDPGNRVRNAKLEKLMSWRNAIAHQDFRRQHLLELDGGRMQLWLQDVKSWRSACNVLVGHMEQVVSTHLTGLTGTAPPW